MSNTISKEQYNRFLNIKMDIIDNEIVNEIINDDTVDDKQNYLIQEYMNSLNEQELIVFNIAKKQLESSFDISESIGYLKWLENK